MPLYVDLFSALSAVMQRATCAMIASSTLATRVLFCCAIEQVASDLSMTSGGAAPAPDAAKSDDAQLAFLMERLLDEQEANAQLRQELAALTKGGESAGAGASPATAAADAPQNFNALTLPELLAERRRVVRSARSLEQAIHTASLRECSRFVPKTREAEYARQREEHARVVHASLRRLRSWAFVVATPDDAEDIHHLVTEVTQEPTAFLKSFKFLRSACNNFNPPPSNVAKFVAALDDTTRMVIFRAVQAIVVAFDAAPQQLLATQRDALDDIARHEAFLTAVVRCITRQDTEPWMLHEVAPLPPAREAPESAVAPATSGRKAAPSPAAAPAARTTRSSTPQRNATPTRRTASPSAAALRPASTPRQTVASTPRQSTPRGPSPQARKAAPSTPRATGAAPALRPASASNATRAAKPVLGPARVSRPAAPERAAPTTKRRPSKSPTRRPPPPQLPVAVAASMSPSRQRRDADDESWQRLLEETRREGSVEDGAPATASSNTGTPAGNPHDDDAVGDDDLGSPPVLNNKPTYADPHAPKPASGVLRTESDEGSHSERHVAFASA